METGVDVNCVHRDTVAVEKPFKTAPRRRLRCRWSKCRKAFVQSMPWQRFCCRDHQQRFHGRLK